MAENVLTILNGIFLLIFGIALTAAFAGLRFTKRTFLILLGFFVFSGSLQLILTLTASDAIVWKLYPLITHLPLVLLLCFVYRKPLVTTLAATFTAYLCCQPAKWFGVLILQFTHNTIAELSARILFLIPVGYIAIFHLSSYLSDIFNKDNRSVCIFGFVPAVYYAFDYITVVYTDLWLSNVRVVMEFLPFFLAIIYLVFCIIYYKEYEQKADAQRKEQIVGITVEQQAKEISAAKQSEQEIRLLRHDMRLFLSSLAVSIENGQTDTAQEMINAQIARIDRTKLERFCCNDIINYVVSDYAARCKNASIPFSCTIELETLTVDEIMFSSILSNALDNALNAQKLLPPSRRSIKLMLKESGSKLLLSIKNPVGRQVLFSDGLPITREDGHGYGAQSIRYMTERLGGNCQFCVQDDTFILRVVL